MHNASFAEHLASWERLASGVSDRVAEATPAMLAQREELIEARRKALEAQQRQLVAQAAAQQATRDFEAAMGEAHEAATRLRSSLWAVYGRQSPKLHAFGMRPYPRKRSRAGAAPLNEGESLPNVVQEPTPPSLAPEAKGKRSPSSRKTKR